MRACNGIFGIKVKGVKHVEYPVGPKRNTYTAESGHSENTCQITGCYKENTTGLEIDSIIEIADGEYGAIEIKLGANQEEEAANNLKRFYNSVEIKPKFMCIICGLYNAIVRRPDGIYILPITALKN